MDAIILENPNIERDWEDLNSNIKKQLEFKPLPAGITSGVPKEVYDAYRLGRDSACVDIVLCTNGALGPQVLLSKRAPNVCFGGKWWIHGGALAAYRPIEEFIADRVEKECGLWTQPDVLIGVYRTCAPDFAGSTLQPCYAAVIPEGLAHEKMRTDPQHQSVRLFTCDELDTIPTEEQHWYPMRVARLALRNMP